MLDLQNILQRSPGRASAPSDALPASDLGHPETQTKVQELLKEAYLRGREETMQKTSQREDALDGLFGEVVAASCMHTLLACKVAMSQGLCWECHNEAFSPHSAHRRCVACDAANTDG